MSEFAAVINLADLTADEAVVLVAASSATATGGSLAPLGDINGDGFNDFIVGAWRDNIYTGAGSQAFVIFGQEGGLPSSITLANLNGTDGFSVTSTTGGLFGYSVSNAGDLNGDGLADFVIGARNSQTGGRLSGSVYVVFGSESGFPAVLPIESLNGTNGFKIESNLDLGRAGRSVTALGDINGDGLDDIAISAPYANDFKGAVYVVFGSASGFDPLINLNQIDGTNGFLIDGVMSQQFLGHQISGGHDVNDDGVNDILIGAPNNFFGQSANPRLGEAFVVFGRDDDSFGAVLNVGDLNGTDGYRIRTGVNDRAGSSVSMTGDINGDGIADMVIGSSYGPVARNGLAYVVFGHGGAQGDLNLTSLDGTNGFKIIGGSYGDQLGASVSIIGDIDGDGFDDLLIGATGVGAGDPGAAYVIFGRANGFAPVINVSALDGTNGFALLGAVGSGQVGFAVSPAGDVNGDGIGDFAVGSRATTNTYIIYGRQTLFNLVGLETDDALTGGAGADTLSGMGGKDVLRGLGDDDTLDGGAANDILYGGLGNDQMRGGDGGDTLFGEQGSDTLNGQAGADKLFGDLGEDILDGGDGNDRLEGGGDADILVGADGNDYLDGGLGADAMTGGVGNDVYIVDDAADTPVELAGEGYDIVRIANSWTLGDNIEGLELQGSGDVNGTGNTLANNIQGNSGSNRLDGGAGVDTLNGNDGDDVIIGGLGNDLLRGGTGADSFIVAHLFGSVLETDQVYDFSTAEGDIIDLSGIDAIAGGADDAFALVGAFNKQAGQMTLSFASGITTLKLDVNGDGKADYQMKITGDVTGDSAGWLL